MSAAWQAVRRLLVARLDNLGDLLMCTPALAALRAGLPQAHITLLTSPGAAVAAPHLPMVDAVLAQAVPWVRAGLADAGAAPPGDGERALLRLLADPPAGAGDPGGGFDAAVILTSATQSPLPLALLCRLAGMPRVAAHCRENPYALLSDWLPETDTVRAGMRHEVQRQLDLVARLLGPAPAPVPPRLQFALRPQDHAVLADRLVAAGLPDDGRPLVLLHPGASAPSRRWPAERFGDAAAAIARDRPDVRIAFVGGDGERPLVAQAIAAMDAAGGTAPAAAGVGAPFDLCGALPLGALAALIGRAAVLVANNSAPAHLAAAVGTPVVSLYALTNPQHVPWGVPVQVLQHDVPCRWCLQSTCPHGHHACLRGVGAAEVARAVGQVLRQPGW